VGIRKASIHHHFPTKEDLIEALLERYASYFLALVDEIAASELRPAAKLRRYVGLFEATLRDGDQDKACLCAMLGAELSTLGSPSAARVRKFYRDNETRLARLLAEGRKRGDFRFDGDAKGLAVALFALLEGGALVARVDGGHRRVRAMGEELLKLLER
jgi:TetR/AcrR family transcriptional repressor of nem operon